MEVKFNIKCNMLALGVSKLVKDGNQNARTEEVLQSPYEGLRAMPNVDGTWIISNLREHLSHASHKPTVKKYYKKR